MKNVMVTGANGFIGSALFLRLSFDGYFVRGSVRSKTRHQPRTGEYVSTRNITDDTNWNVALAGINIVIHTAARVHLMQDSSTDSLDEFRKVNVAGTLNLARQAATSGVSRFIFISSIKVNGEETMPGQPFKVSDKPSPVDCYAISKFEAEQGLRELAADTGMEVVIVRPPLVYGRGVKANFQSMMRCVERGVPLPLGSIHNKRSFVALDNLIDLITVCIDHPAAANQTFLAGDGEDISTSELLQRIGKALGKPVRLIPLPSSILIFLASLVGKKAVTQRLCGSLQADISDARMMLGWEPPVSVNEGLRRALGNSEKMPGIKAL